MKTIRKILYFYSLFFTLSLFLQGLRMIRTTTDLALIILLSGPTLFFLLTFVQMVNRQIFDLKKLQEIAFYLKMISFVNSLFLVFIALVGLIFYYQYLFVLVFLPLPLYFLLIDFDQEAKEGNKEFFQEKEDEQPIINYPAIKEIRTTNKEKNIDLLQTDNIHLSKKEKQILNEELKEIKDPLRRQFLKMIGVSGVGFFIAALINPKKTEAAFFGSVPGPGTVALKNTMGQRIDPAEKKPTDGYTISQIDDSSPSYYGYLDKDGNWYIIKENSDGSFRYVRGVGSFSSYWSNRSSLSYDYFDNVF